MNDYFIPLQVDTTDESSKAIVDQLRQIWTPDLRVVGADGFEYDAFQGYWPPTEFKARLLLGRARALARQHREGEAEDAYNEVVVQFPRTIVAAEAAYWRAVCRYKRTHESDDLLQGWSRVLPTHYPYSQWRMAQSFTEPPLQW